jgi:hypothetical protein
MTESICFINCTSTCWREIFLEIAKMKSVLNVSLQNSVGESHFKDIDVLTNIRSLSLSTSKTKVDYSMLMNTPVLLNLESLSLSTSNIYVGGNLLS